MKKLSDKIAAILILSGLGLAGGLSFAAEFEVLDRFSVDGYTVLRGSADIPGGSFAVGGSTLVVKSGNVGIGTTGPAAKLEIRGLDTQAYNLAVGTSAAYSLVVSTGGNVGIGTTNPLSNFEVAGEIKLGYSASACSLNTAGTLRWYDGHISVCNGSAWRQLDNQPPPTITTITPAAGVVTGGTAITIAGTGFNQGLEFTIGGAPATSIALSGAIQITAVTPAGTEGSREVRIVNSDGQYVTGAFTYNPLPTSGGPVSPASGTEGTVITITGTGFVTGLTVKIDSAQATINSVSAGQIVAVAPVNAATGAKNIIITNPDTGAVTLTGGFTYLSPTVTDVNPAYGSGLGGTVITITGTSFVNATGLAVTIGGVPATNFTWNSATQITATTPANSASGSKTVMVTNRDSGSGTKTNGFTYTVYATGGTVSSSGIYRIHTFNTGATLTVNTGGNMEVLVVAGGGGGGNGNVPGAGGAGGVIYRNSYAVAAGGTTVTIGAGGAVATKGSDSVFGSLTAIGGGRGGNEQESGTGSGHEGGSGGGAAYSPGASTDYTNLGGTAQQPGSASGGFGNAGGRGSRQTLNHNTAGGGGAGQLGTDGVYGAASGGKGGNGLAYSISGASVYYGGGGGGAAWSGGTGTSAGGLGGGGIGGYYSVSQGAAANGAANTGGGGGAGYTGGVSGIGGSGIVIVRYPLAASLWDALPSLGSVSPVSGRRNGGYTITLTGSNFATPAAVTIGGIPAEATTTGSSQIIATVPDLASSGAKNIVVTNPGGQASTLTGGFTAFRPGETQAAAGLSCYDIQLSPGGSVGNGVYWVDPNGGATTDAFQAYCDMTTNGGGWTLVFASGINTYDTTTLKTSAAYGTVPLSLSCNGADSKFSDATIRSMWTQRLRYTILADSTQGMTRFSDTNVSALSSWSDQCALNNKIVWYFAASPTVFSNLAASHGEFCGWSYGGDCIGGSGHGLCWSGPHNGYATHLNSTGAHITIPADISALGSQSGCGFGWVK